MTFLTHGAWLVSCEFLFSCLLQRCCCPGRDGASTQAASDDSDEDGDEDDNDDAGGGDGGLAAESGSQPSDDGEEDEDGASDGGGGGGDDGPGGGGGADGVVRGGGAETADSPGADGRSAEAAESNRAKDIAVARRLLYDEAVRKRDDLMMRRMRQQMLEETQMQKDASTEVGLLLRKRAQEQRAEEAKRRRAALEDERLAAKDLEETKVIRAKAEQATAEARLAALRQIILNRRDAEARKHAQVTERAFQRWLQTQFPAQLARRCISILRGMSAGAKKGFEREVSSLLGTHTLKRQLFIKDLWVSDSSLTLAWSTAPSFTGGPRRSVRCGLPFQELVDKVAPRSRTMFAQDPVETLFLLFSACVPCARRVFTDAYTPLRLLHVNDYVLEKTFVYGIVALSKWLGQDRFAHGVYEWPPQMPADLVPKYKAAEAIHFDSTPPSHDVPPPLPPPDHAVPPHLRMGSPSASSASASAAG